jgi:hypothetical protein
MSPEEVDTGKRGNAARYWRPARLFIGILMGIETALLFNVCIGFAMFVLFLGGMSFLVSGGTASEANLAAGWRAIWACALGPFLWPLLLAGCTINLFLRKRAWLIIIGCAVSIIIELGLLLAIYRHDPPPNPENPGKSNSLTMFIVLAIVLIVIHLAGIVVALRMKQKEM